MDERESINGFSSLYIGDIEISLEQTITSIISLENEDKEIVAAKVFPISTFQ